MLTAYARQYIADDVAYCADIMDSVRPGWYDLIDETRLNVADRVGCVVGQVWPDRAFSEVWRELLLPHFDYRQFACSAFNTVFVGAGRMVRHAATRETNLRWMEEIRARRETDRWLTALYSRRRRVA
jgi:hypothetical protein